MTVVLVDYGAGNLRSAAKALAVAGAARIEVTAEPEAVRRADRIVLPGVGAFGACIGGIRAVPGLEEALGEAVLQRGRPFLGICVGMQLLAGEGQEFGVHRGLGWIPGTVRRMAPESHDLRIPQIGWNDVTPLPRTHGALIEPGWAYFVHSYAFHPEQPADCCATIDYGGTITAAVARDTILGVQFHPEKSQGFGLRLLARFLAWNP
ncbi:imidazole glycerol phosphate synthase subunit HisH [Thermaurantiacus sp.]